MQKWFMNDLVQTGLFYTSINKLILSVSLDSEETLHRWNSQNYKICT